MAAGSTARPSGRSAVRNESLCGPPCRALAMRVPRSVWVASRMMMCDTSADGCALRVKICGAVITDPKKTGPATVAKMYQRDWIRSRYSRRKTAQNFRIGPAGRLLIADDSCFHAVGSHGLQED